MTCHIKHVDPTYGAIPLCGRAMWDGLVAGPPELVSAINECWECASIAGVPYLDEGERAKLADELEARKNASPDPASG